MCIYCGTNKYRKIYEHHYGPIPVDDFGRSFEIHHKDGNHSNNNFENLEALSLQDHYYKHLEQEDWGACILLAEKLKLPPSVISELSSKTQNKRIKEKNHPFIVDGFQKNIQMKLIEEGRHNFLTNNPSKKEENREKNKTIQNKKVIEGVHPFLDKEFIVNNTENNRKIQNDLVDKGIHHFLGDSNPVHQKVIDGSHHWIGPSGNLKMLQQGKHPSQKKVCCEHCQMTVSSANYKRWHGANCKHINNRKQEPI